MLRTVGLIEVRPFSESRLEEREVQAFFHRSFGGKPLLDWVVRRVTDAQLLDAVIVVCDASCATDVRQRCPADVPVVGCQRKEAVRAYSDAAKRLEAEAIVRLPAGNPLLDPALIDRLIASAGSCSDCDYATYCSQDGRRVLHSSLGVCAEWGRTEAIQRAERMAKSARDCRDPLRFMYAHPEQFSLRLTPIPRQLDRDDVRLAVESEEDWEHAHVIYDALGPECLDWQRIARLLDDQPALRARMAELNGTGAPARRM